MAKDRDSDASSVSQSKRPTPSHFDSSESQHHRTKSQKHIVGGGLGGRLHARVPSSKALHKHHASASTSKLSRRRSLSPDQAAGPPLASTHRRATSDLKLTDDASSSNLKSNSSQTSLKRNRSHVEIGKKTKSAINLTRSHSNPTVHKLRSSGASKVHFNLGDDGQDDSKDDFDPDEEGDQDDEWVDASASASPLLSRRGSTAIGAQIAQPPATTDATQLASASSAHSLSQSLSRDLASHKQYLTSRILQRTPSHGAPPMMSVENVSVRPGSSRQNSPDSGIGHDTSTPSGTPHTTGQGRPGSSGKQELTSRFVGGDSQEPGSEIPGDSFLAAVQHGGISRAAVNGKPEVNGPRRPRSMGSLARARGQNHDAINGVHAPIDDATLTDEEDVDTGVLPAGPRGRRNGGFAMPTDMSRTQQKLNLQRASSSLESAHPHPRMGMGLGGVAVAPGSLVGGSSYDSRDPRLGKFLERTGMEYLVVRRYQNPVARSLARLAQLPGADKNRPIPRTGNRPGTAHSKRTSELGGGRSGPGSGLRERESRDPSVATLIGGQSARRPATPRSAFSSRQLHSTSSSPETDDGVSRIHERHGLSGSSLVNGEEDAGTIALLRNMWDKNMDLSASQD